LPGVESLDGWDAVKEYKLSFTSAYRAAACCPGRLWLNDCCGTAPQPVDSKPVATTAPWCPLHSRILRKPRTLFRYPLPQLSNPQRRRQTRHIVRKLQPQLLLSGAGSRFRKGNSRWSIPVSIGFLCQLSCSIPSVGFRALCLWIELRTIGSFPSAML